MKIMPRQEPIVASDRDEMIEQAKEYSRTLSGLLRGDKSAVGEITDNIATRLAKNLSKPISIEEETLRKGKLGAEIMLVAAQLIKILYELYKNSIGAMGEQSKLVLNSIKEFAQPLLAMGMKNLPFLVEAVT